MTSKKIDALEEMMKQMMIANEKRDAALDNLCDTLTKTAARARDDNTEQDKRDAIFRQLEEERLLKEAELKAKYAAAGFEYNTPQGTNNSDGDHNSRTNDKSEHVKIEQVGIVQPLASHAEWTGQAHDSNNNSVWVSFKAWLQHLEAVLSQKDTIALKRAVLDCASLSCLRAGRALDWWNALSAQQQQSLRHDCDLHQWYSIGKPLFTNATLSRKEGRDRKRLHSETLSEYAWKKLAMLNEACGRERPAEDVISDIKEGLSYSDQERIRTDLDKHPTITRLMAELERLDSIRGPKFKETMSQGRINKSDRTHDRGTDKARYQETASRDDKGPRKPLSESYDPAQLAFRKNPMIPLAEPQWSYAFPNSHTIFLSTPCSHCGAMHFNFECKKRETNTKPRAAMAFDAGWDEAHEIDDDDSDGEDDFMETACSKYMCITPATWAYYGKTEKEKEN
jgi:hypothetical protein